MGVSIAVGAAIVSFIEAEWMWNIEPQQSAPVPVEQSLLALNICQDASMQPIWVRVWVWVSITMALNTSTLLLDKNTDSKWRQQCAPSLCVPVKPPSGCIQDHGGPPPPPPSLLNQTHCMLKSWHICPAPAGPLSRHFSRTLCCIA